jgi:hypothetical protein
VNRLWQNASVRAVDQVLPERIEAAAGPGPAPPRRRADLWAYLSYLCWGVVVLGQLWLNPSGRVLSSNDDDHGFFLFVAAHGERVVFHGANPFFSDRLNVPDGVNMMANTSVLALSLPFAPVTHWFGPGVTVVLLLTLGLAGTAAAWYRVLSRHLVRSRLAAWVGGAWCGFCPALVGHANGHVNFVSQFVVPFLIWQVFRLREPGRILRGGVIVGLLIVLQVFLNEETLLFTAISLAVFVVVWAAMRWRAALAVAGRFLAGLGVAAGVAGVLLAYPLWFQFAGPGSYAGQPFPPDQYVTDLLSIGAYSRQALAGNGAIARALSVSATEENTFFGLPLVILLGIAVRMLWRSVFARAVAITAVVLLVMSMGPRLQVAKHLTAIRLPFGLVSHVPIVDLVSVTRFAMVTATLVGVLLAMAVDRAGEYPRRRRVAFGVALAVALVPVIPKPLPVVAADPLPPFIAEGTWRSYVPAGRTLVTVPLPEVTSGRAGMRWIALTHLAYASPRGYFMGPADPPADRTGSWHAPPRFTSNLLWRVREYGRVPRITAVDRQAFAADLVYWRAGVVVLVPDSRNGPALLATLTALFGRPPQQVGGVQLWVPPPG